MSEKKTKTDVETDIALIKKDVSSLVESVRNIHETLKDIGTRYLTKEEFVTFRNTDYGLIKSIVFTLCGSVLLIVLTAIVGIVVIKF